MYTTHWMGRDGQCQKFDTTPTLISAPQWLHRPCTNLALHGRQKAVCESRPGYV